VLSNFPGWLGGVILYCTFSLLGMSLERVLLRSLLREIRELARLQRVRMSKSGDTRESDLKVKARAPLAPSGWGRGEYVLRRVDEERRVWSELFGRENEVGARRENEVGARIVQRALLRSEVSRDMEDGVRWTDVRSLVVQASRSLGNEGTGSHAVVDAGLAALRVIAEQRELTECTAVTTTPSTDDGVDMVHVEATSRYIPWVSTEGRSVFAYRIYIENVHPSRTCRLLARHWIFRKAGGEVVVEVPRGTASNAFSSSSPNVPSSNTTRSYP